MLITLVIIGVIAALTIPTLMSKTRDQETLTKLKKAYSVLANAAKINVAQNGNFNFDETLDSFTPEAGKDLMKNIKTARDCYSNSDSCKMIGAGDAEFTGTKYIISDDGIIYGFHGTEIINGEKVMPVRVDLSNYENLDNTDGNVPAAKGNKLIAYGFYIKEDGTVVVPAGNPDFTTLSNPESLKTMQCPMNYDSVPDCTFWTLMTGKVQKKSNEWID